MISAYLKAIGQLGDRKMRRIVWLNLILALLVLIVSSVVAWWSLTYVPWSDLPVIGWAIGFLGDTADTVGGFAFGLVMLVVAFFLFPGLMTALAGVFLDGVVDIVESKHYPGAPPSRRIGIVESVASALKFVIIIIVVNLIALPFYLILMVTGIGAPILYYIVNGYLVGREFFEVVAFRRLPPDLARSLRRSHRARILLYGAGTVFLMNIPFVNLITPVLATAAMVHVFQGLPRRQEFEGLATR